MSKSWTITTAGETKLWLSGVPRMRTNSETAGPPVGPCKQDYITRRLLCRDIVVQGSPRVYKALRNQLAAVLEELERIEAGAGVDDELLDTIRLIAATLDGMRED